MKEFDRSLTLLFQVGNAISQLNKQAEKNLKISLVQWCLLRHLIDMPAAPASTLSQAIAVHPSTLTQTLKRLEKKKLIFVAEDPRDSRKKLISITREGKLALDRVTAKIEQTLIELTSINGVLSQVQGQIDTFIDRGL